MTDVRNYERIWLQPSCSDGCDKERCWAEHDLGPCDECGKPCVEYIRAECAAVHAERIKALENDCDRYVEQEAIRAHRDADMREIVRINNDYLLSRIKALEAENAVLLRACDMLQEQITVRETIIERLENEKEQTND